MQPPEQPHSKGLVVIGFAESFSSPEVTWSLVEAGYEVVAFARRDSKAALGSSRHARVFEITAPEEDTAATIRELEAELGQLIKTTNRPVCLLVLDDAALWIRTKLQANPRLTVVGPADPSVALKKDLQIELAQLAGFKVPATQVVTGENGGAVPSFGFPLILKPVGAITETGGRLDKGRFHICHNAADYAAALEKIPQDGTMMAQQYVTGTGEGLFGLAARDGVMAWSGHRRIRMMNPAGSGASACVSIAPQTAEVAAGTNFIARSGWRGPFMIELLRDEQGATWFMEFNGRIWGSTALARRCGLEYPAWAVADALGRGESLPHAPVAPAGVVCRHAGREFVHGLFVLRGPRAQTTTRWPSRGRTLGQLLRFRRTDFWYNWRRDDWRVFVKDSLATIAGNVLKKRPAKRA